MSLSPVPQDNQIAPKTALNPVWQAWFNSVFFWLSPIGQSGATGSRPTKNLYAGLTYFDTTLNLPIWVKTVSPTVWINAAGSTV